MEELAIKIAETLDISVQGAIDIYPVIRSQYIWYEVLTIMALWMVILIIASIIIIGVAGVNRDYTDKFDLRNEKITEDWVSIDKVFKKAILALLVFIVITIAISIVIPILAPDVMLIKNLLG